MKGLMKVFSSGLALWKRMERDKIHTVMDCLIKKKRFGCQASKENGGG